MHNPDSEVFIPELSPETVATPRNGGRIGRDFEGASSRQLTDFLLMVDSRT